MNETGFWDYFTIINIRRWNLLIQNLEYLLKFSTLFLFYFEYYSLCNLTMKKYYEILLRHFFLHPFWVFRLHVKQNWNLANCVREINCIILIKAFWWLARYADRLEIFQIFPRIWSEKIFHAQHFMIEQRNVERASWLLNRNRTNGFQATIINFITNSYTLRCKRIIFKWFLNSSKVVFHSSLFDSLLRKKESID